MNLLKNGPCLYITFFKIFKDVTSRSKPLISFYLCRSSWYVQNKVSIKKLKKTHVNNWPNSNQGGNFLAHHTILQHQNLYILNLDSNYVSIYKTWKPSFRHTSMLWRIKMFRVSCVDISLSGFALMTNVLFLDNASNTINNVNQRNFL